MRTVIWAGVALHLLCGDAHAYVDPGSLQPIWGTVAPIAAIVLATLLIALWPVRRALSLLRRAWRKSPGWVNVTITIAVLVVLLFAGHHDGREEESVNATTKRASTVERVILLGIDGLDPRLCEEMMERNELPNMDRLRRLGTFMPLQTTVPPESPVAWASAASGCNPGKHGLFDFIHREPSNYGLRLSLVRPNPEASKGSARFVAVRHGPSFWQVASKAGVPVTVIRWPTTFPPEPVSGRMLSGLGTPDVGGHLGEYSFFTTKMIDPEDKAPERVVAVQWEGDVIKARLPGPLVAGALGAKRAALPLQIERQGDTARLTVSGQKVGLKPGTWSDWVVLEFSRGMTAKIPAMVRFHLVSLTPDFQLYASAAHVDPLSPAFPLSYPAEYAEELAREMGRFHTLGMPEDNQAVTHGRYSLDEFLDQCEQVTREREQMFDLELKHFDRGILAFVFDTNDRISHMTWFARDPQHPMYSAELAEKYGMAIRDHYRRMDGIVGKALAKADENTLVLVISDHGFKPFRNCVHLNTWLYENGYLVLKDKASIGEPLLGNVDWSQTRAYAAGFCGLYINVKGREGQGVVEAWEYKALRDELRGHLEAFYDPLTNARVVHRVYAREEVYSGTEMDMAPDLIIGYEPGYRASWQTALGAAPNQKVIEPNESFWSGDHLVDPGAVPGVLFCNRPVHSLTPRLIDIAPTVLAALGVDPPVEMDGSDLLDD